jgi:hypothetical protein
LFRVVLYVVPDMHEGLASHLPVAELYVVPVGQLYEGFASHLSVEVFRVVPEGQVTATSHLSMEALYV